MLVCVYCAERFRDVPTVGIEGAIVIVIGRGVVLGDQIVTERFAEEGCLCRREARRGWTLSFIIPLSRWAIDWQQACRKLG